MGFEFGITQPLQCRRVDLGGVLGLRILYISDVHLGVPHSRKACEQIISTVRLIQPDLILIGGDLVDSRTGIALVAEFIKRLSELSQVAVVPGNHDRRACIESVKEAVIAGHAIWLEDQSLALLGKNEVKCQIVGKLSQLDSVNCYTILCTHDPANYPEAIEKNVNLTLAGHLHGGQIIIYSKNGIHYPGYLVNKWTQDICKVNNSVLVVSKGITELIPVRLNCPREVILCEL